MNVPRMWQSSDGGVFPTVSSFIWVLQWWFQLWDPLWKHCDLLQTVFCTFCFPFAVECVCVPVVRWSECLLYYDRRTRCFQVLAQLQIKFAGEHKIDHSRSCRCIVRAPVWKYLTHKNIMNCISLWFISPGFAVLYFESSTFIHMEHLLTVLLIAW